MELMLSLKNCVQEKVQLYTSQKLSWNNFSNLTDKIKHKHLYRFKSF